VKNKILIAYHLGKEHIVSLLEVTTVLYGALLPVLCWFTALLFDHEDGSDAFLRIVG
jgi:hypothetical protein